MKKKIKRIGHAAWQFVKRNGSKVLGATVAVGATMVGGVAKAAIDMTDVADGITTDVSSAIPIGLGIMGLTFGIAVAKKAFKTAAR